MGDVTEYRDEWTNGTLPRDLFGLEKRYMLRKIRSAGMLSHAVLVGDPVFSDPLDPVMDSLDLLETWGMTKRSLGGIEITDKGLRFLDACG
jgi:hypothetical protein